MITKILTLSNIAGWDIQNNVASTAQEIRAKLPEIQRGYVWKPQQVEALWDSIVQGFPIGSLLLSNTGSEMDYDLVDGQQRATAIAIGFRNIWTANNSEYKEKDNCCLWIDLNPLENNEKRYAFYLLTKSHPWGYSKSGKTLSLTNIRSSLEIFRTINGDEKILPYDLNLKEVFPWEAKCPVPVAFIIAAIEEKEKDIELDIAQYVLKELKETNIWKYRDINEKIKSQFINVENKLKYNDKFFNEIIEKLKWSLNNLEVPAPVLKIDKTTKNENDVSDTYNPLFNLFKRINSGGTSLSSEDIKYSMLKSVWPDAKNLIEGVLVERNLGKPERMVSIFSRLLLSKDSSIHKELSISQFSSKISNKEDGFLSDLECFCKDKSQGNRLLKNVWEFLTYKEYGLPIVMSSQFSRKGGDLLLLVMHWIFNMDREYKWETVTDYQKQQALGFITAINWFTNANNTRKCFSYLSIIKEGDKIEDFFSSKRFISLVGNKDIGFPAFLSPEALSDTLKVCYEGTSLRDDEWKVLGKNGVPDNVKKYYNTFMDENEKEYIKIWWDFFSTVTKSKSLLLYSQRSFMNKLFSWFDTTMPNNIRDQNRPWDYDHILPHNWTNHDSRSKSIPLMLRFWVNMIGNYRAWPLELNRAKGDGKIIDNTEDVKGYNISNVLKDSFIIGDNLLIWERLNDVKNLKKTFLSNDDYQKIFVKASVLRTIAIYEEWYTTLHIDNLQNTSNASK